MTNTVELGFQDYWEMVVRRKWLIVSCVVSAIGVASALCVVLPRSFRSTTTVLVESQKIPESYVQSVVGGTIEERLSSIQQVVLSRSLLTQVAEEFHLFNENVTPEEKEGVINAMRKNVKVDTVDSSGARGRSIEAFSISFSHGDPVVAMRVTERFASQFIEQNLKIREQLVEGASDFLEQELRLSKEKLEAQEKLISEFKTKNIGELPQQVEANLRSLDRIQLELNATSESIQSLSSRLSGIDKQINEYKVTGRSSSVNDAGQTNVGRIDPLIARLAELERSLAALKAADYKDTYPDVVSARQEIDTVKEQLAQKYGVSREEVKQGSSNVFDPVMKELIRQHENTRIELEGLKERERRLHVQKSQFEGRVERTPAHEQDLMILIRDYENTQKAYQTLLEKKLNARVAENLEKRQKGEQFRIIDPANLPVAPEKPNRPLILLGGLAVGCAMGFGSAFLIEMLRPAFRRPEEAESFLGLPILASIPSFATLIGVKGRAPSAGATGLLERKRSALLPSYGAEKRHGPPTATNALSLRHSIGHEASLNLIAKWWPHSMIAEQYRVAATRLALISTEQKHSVVLVTSSVMGEGKSSTTVNLGHVLAQALDRNTLIIDCDLKRPTVNKYLSTPSGPGLTDYWARIHPLDSCLHKMPDCPLWVLPAGTRSGQVVELSKIRQLADLIEEVRPRFDHILLDSPPVFPLADVNLLSGMADVMVFVIRAGRTGRDVVEKALKTMRPQCKVGLILAGIESTSMPYYLYDYNDPVAVGYQEDK
jgi:polysaccharide biosynthesis transport protein